MINGGIIAIHSGLGSLLISQCPPDYVGRSRVRILKKSLQARDSEIDPRGNFFLGTNSAQHVAPRSPYLPCQPPS